jgi:hypothetical protein
MLASAAAAPQPGGQDTGRLEGGGANVVQPPQPDKGLGSGGVTLVFHNLGACLSVDVMQGGGEVGMMLLKAVVA